MKAQPSQAEGWNAHHLHDLGIHILRDDSPLGGDVVEHLRESLRLYSFALQIRRDVAKVKDDGSLAKLLDEEVVSFMWRHIEQRG